MPLQNALGGLALDASVQQIVSELAAGINVSDATAIARLTSIQTLLSGTITVGGSVAVSNFPATQAVSEAHLPNLDIALSALRDAITKTGVTSKTLADVVAALAATLNVQFPAAQHVIVDSAPAEAHLNSSTDSVTVAATQATWWDTRGLVERMTAKAPASGYTLWLDVASSDATHIYVAEVLAGTLSSATGFRGIRLALDANGSPLGAVGVNTNFIWDNRASVAWAS